MLSSAKRRWVDLGGAITSGLVVSYHSQSAVSFIKPMWSTYSDFLFTAIYVCAYIAAALVTFKWRNALTAKLGWVIIAILGAALCAVTDELSSRITPDDAFSGVFMLPIGILTYSLFALLTMALVHYLAPVLIRNHSKD